MLLIGLAGSAGVGKDEVADYLVKEHNFIKFSFSDLLYSEVSDAFGISMTELKDRDSKEKPSPWIKVESCSNPEFRALMIAFCGRNGVDYDTTEFSPRWVLQQWGTEYRRAQNANYWIDAARVWLRNMTEALNDTPLHGMFAGFVNTSVRFPNEQAFIHEEGGVVWHVRRFKDTDDASASGVASGLDHIAEQGLPMLGGESELFNHGTVEQLHTLATLLLHSPAGGSVGRHVTLSCNECDTLHTLISREQAQAECDAFMERFPGRSPVAVEDYMGCVCCGAHSLRVLPADHPGSLQDHQPIVIPN
jgi:hypothetical protein